MSLVELIARADERGLAASGLACLDRCLPLLGGDDETLRPLWAGLADGDGGAWRGLWERVRGELGGARGCDEAALLVHRMLADAPAAPDGAGVRGWADACSLASLRVHRLLEPAEGAVSLGADSPGVHSLGTDSLDAVSLDVCREGRTEGAPPLVAAELRRQSTVLELLAEHGPGGLRRALEVSAEGRRVLRAVVSRRARLA